jgi:hypothetical protein
MQGIAEVVSKAMYYLYDGGVVWDSWLKLADYFMFVVTPTVNTAVLTPYAPMLTSPVTTIIPEQYVYIRNLSVMRKPIAAMVLTDHISLSTNGDIVAPDAVSVSVANETKGMLDAVPMPAWLSGPVMMSTTAATYDTLIGIRSRTSEAASIAALRGKVAGGNAVRNMDVRGMKNIGEAYARAALGDRLFGSNTMTIVGPLRFDICPGTVVAVESISDARSADSNIVNYGFVSTVSIEVNAETGSASTTIILSHVRNASDNVRFGSTSSALYSGKYTGRSLLT